MDKGFTVQSPLAVNALKSANEFFAWCRAPENHSDFKSFSSEVVAHLSQKPFPPVVKNSKQREQMWGTYHQIRSSTNFQETWLQALRRFQGCVACPIFYQYVTDHLFRQMVKQHFPLKETDQLQSEYSNLTLEEASGLRYAAGYVCRAMRKRFGSKNPDLLECIDELIDSANGEGEDGLDSTSDWIKLASRGGLLHVKDSTYRVFHAMELVVRQFFRREGVEMLPSNPTTKALTTKELLKRVLT